MSNGKFLPLMIDLDDRKVVIFGGGHVGERKSFLFSKYAQTTVISELFTPGLEELARNGKVKLIRTDVTVLSDDAILELLHDSFVVIPAINNESLNRRIIDIARKNDILINQVDGIGDIVVPSVIQRGDLTVSISTMGSSPAVSKYIRKKIEQVITPEYSQMIKIQDELRTYLKMNVHDQRARKDILWKVLEDSSVWDALGISYEKAYNIAYNIVLEQIDKIQD